MSKFIEVNAIKYKERVPINLVELDLVELLEKRKPSCVNCRHADYKNNSTVYCLKHNCGMLSNTCCRNWEDEDEKG